MALYQAISRTEILKSGSFLWMNLGERDPFFILPIVAAILTYATSKLTMMSQAEANSNKIDDVHDADYDFVDGYQLPECPVAVLGSQQCLLGRTDDVVEQSV